MFQNIFMIFFVTMTDLYLTVVIKSASKKKTMRLKKNIYKMLAGAAALPRARTT